MADLDVKPVLLYIIEDDERTREELGRILGRHTEFNIRSFSTPAEVLARLEHESPDMALLDLRLPGMDGLTLLERIQEQAPEVMAIVMTGYGEAATPRLAREKGAVDFVEKPLDLTYLLVTLRQQAREARLRSTLKSSAQLFSKVLDMMPDGILMSDSSERVLFSNSLGKKLWDLGADEAGSHTPHEGRVYVLEKNRSGDRVLWHWVDITRALERERAAGYRQMARLLAHELRNPLTPMRLWLQELEALPDDDPKFVELSREASGVLLQQVNRLTELVQRFKTLGEEQPLSLVQVAVKRVVAEVLRALGPLAEQGDVILSDEGLPELWAVAEESALYHLLFNLVRNAIEAAAGREGGSVLVSAREDGDRVLLEIKDDGGGLPEEVAAAPCTPYLTTKEGGTGLGLLVCRELANRMGGEFDLANQPGVGVTARLVLNRGKN
jgi:signal transduction histidine kinase/FixJ family two-component response regulator